jgi:hypothetical protein
MMAVPRTYIQRGKVWDPQFIEFDALTNVSFTQRVVCTGSDPFYIHKDIIGTISNEKFNLLNPSSQLTLPGDNFCLKFISELCTNLDFAKGLEHLLSTLSSPTELLNILKIQHETFYQCIFDGAYASDPTIIMDKNLMKELKLNLNALSCGEFHFFSDFAANLGTPNWSRQTKTGLTLSSDANSFRTLPVKLKTREEFMVPFH